jgi:putative hemolysin
MNDSGLLIAGKLAAVLLLVLANGFFVAAEFALVAVRRSRVDQLVAQGRPLARNLKRAVTHLDTYLAATQLGVTMSSLGLGWLGEPAIAHWVEPALAGVLPEAIASLGAHTLAIVIAFTVITSLHIVLGELAPKSLALQRPEETSLYVITLLDLYLALFRPAVMALNNLGNWVLSLLGLHTGSSEEMVHSPEEIRLLVSASRQAGLLGETEEDVVERVFRLGDQRISALMTPRINVVWLDIEQPVHKLQEKIITNVYSHYPVCRENVDDLLGFVTAKEALAASIAEPLTLTKLIDLLTPPLYVPEVMTAFNGLKVFKQTGQHVAAVVDEYGTMQGLVTLNDILEAIVGDIRTGNEPAEPEALRREDGAWLLDGLLPIEEFMDIFGLRELPDREESLYQTIGGLVLTHLGHVPQVSESFEWHNFQIEVAGMKRNRVSQVLVRPLGEATPHSEKV